MKKIIGTLFIITVLLITFSSSDYVDAASYDSKASITFIEPEDDELSEGDESEAGDIPGGIIVVADEGKLLKVQSEESLMENSSKSKAKSILPKTATNMYSILLLGLVIIVIGVSFLIYYNRKEKTNKYME